MPIFHDYLEPESNRQPFEQIASNWAPRAETSDGGLGAPSNNDLNMTSPQPSPRTTNGDNDSAAQYYRPSMLDRAELIERIKRENSPSWQHSRSASPSALEKEKSRHGWWRTAQTLEPGFGDNDSKPRIVTRESRPQSSSEQNNSRRSSSPTSRFYHEQATAGLHIQRPSSALHRGDFHEKKKEDLEDKNSSNSGAIFATSPVVPWHPSFPAAADPLNRPGSPHPGQASGSLQRALHAARPRAISQLTLSSPFIFMPPTTPLVQQSNNSDLDFPSRWDPSQSSRSPDASNRRHTFSPSSFQSFQNMRSPKREGVPCQAHQPRRSIVSMNQFQAQSTPQTPLMQPRRPSVSDASPLHHAPMVGSYEESILRGRMSTTPSRPFDFIARIGVMGRGNCKDSLRCPPHVTIPFPAVFYSYHGGNARLDDSPSPYVGLIDLENGLPAPKEAPRARRKRRHVSPVPAPEETGIVPGPPECNTPDDIQALKEKSRRREKLKRRSASPKAPPGGCYRIPQQGQIQIVIKNPNNTAVKLFLIPYNLSAMEPGQKTFIRQRSYSAGPIIDMPMSCRNNLGTDRPEASLSNSDDPRDRPILRYLVHLHICCPAKGRFYLYKSIRVVFANRVPDGKEALRNETQLPDPPYSAYKPSRDSANSHSTIPTAAQFAEEAARRASIGHPVLSQPLDRLNGYNPRPPPPPPPAVQLTGAQYPTYSIGLDPSPCNMVSRAGPYPAPGEPVDYTPQNPSSPYLGPSLLTSLDSPIASFTKLKRGEAGYGGSTCGGMGGPAESLLAKKLRGLPLEDQEMDS